MPNMKSINSMITSEFIFISNLMHQSKYLTGTHSCDATTIDHHEC